MPLNLGFVKLVGTIFNQLVIWANFVRFRIILKIVIGVSKSGQFIFDIVKLCYSTGCVQLQTRSSSVILISTK